MYTSILLIALTGTLVRGETASEPSPTLYGDYAIARQKSTEENKPLAVLVGRGEKGYRAVHLKGKPSPGVEKRLSEGYVCLYLDLDTKTGKRVAKKLDLGKGPGLLITDVGGKTQAFRHPGKLSNRHLNRYLSRYADPERVVHRTEYHHATVRVAAATAFAPMQATSGSC